MPVNFTQAERTRLLQFRNYGRGTAVNAAAIAAHMGYPMGGNQVKTRNLITECIEHGQDLIASTLKKPRGYYKIRRNNIQELNDYLNSLENRAREINNRRTNLINNWNTVVPANQTNRKYFTLLDLYPFMEEFEEEQPIYKHAKPFGKKEKVLNYTSNAYQLTRPSKVGAVMALIRECQPKTFEEWQQYYFEKAHTKTKVPIKVTKEILNELGERLYEKITEVVIPEWTEAFKQITKQDCYDYVYEVTIPRTYDGFITEKSIVNDFLAKKFPDIKFEESDSDLDHTGDVDYIGRVGDKAFGIQIKPVTGNANFGNYKLTERMQANFEAFEEKYGGKVFVVFSTKVGNKKEIQNKEVIDEIIQEIKRLS